MINHLWFFIILSLLAEILGTVGGFGSSVFFVPFANLFLDFQSVLAITAIFHLSSNITKIAMFRKGIDWKLVLIIGIPATIFVTVGAFLSVHVSARPLEIGLGIFLIAMALIFIIFKQIVIKPNLVNGIAGGSAAGILAGLFGSGGAVRGLTLAAYNLRKEVFIATSAIIDLAIDASRSVVYFSNGYVHKGDLYLIPILLVVSIIGTYIGKKFLDKISHERFKQIVLFLILGVGLMSLIRTLFFENGFI